MERMGVYKDYWSFENTRESEHMAQQQWLRQEEKPGTAARLQYQNLGGQGRRTTGAQGLVAHLEVVAWI